MDDNLRHHDRYEYCRTRLKYRQGRTLTAVKAYTAANESKHLLVFGVPKINLQTEVKKLLQKYGPVEIVNCVTSTITKEASNYTVEQFTDVFYAKFKQLQHSRRAKKFLDARNFYGGILHISYAPEYETVDELRQKLDQRKKEIRFRTNIILGKRKIVTNE